MTESVETILENIRDFNSRYAAAREQLLIKEEALNKEYKSKLQALENERVKRLRQLLKERYDTQSTLLCPFAERGAWRLLDSLLESKYPTALISDEYEVSLLCQVLAGTAKDKDIGRHFGPDLSEEMTQNIRKFITENFEVLESNFKITRSAYARIKSGRLLSIGKFCNKFRNESFDYKGQPIHFSSFSHWKYAWQVCLEKTCHDLEHTIRDGGESRDYSIFATMEVFLLRKKTSSLLDEECNVKRIKTLE